MSRSATGRDESRIGDFVVENEIGKGSFAVVHRGYRVQPREPVAVKIVTRKKLTPKLLDNLEGEIAILKAIHHPNIVELKDCLKTEHQIYLVMAFCPSGDLSQYIKKRSTFTSVRVLLNLVPCLGRTSQSTHILTMAVSTRRSFAPS